MVGTWVISDKQTDPGCFTPNHSFSHAYANWSRTSIMSVICFPHTTVSPRPNLVISLRHKHRLGGDLELLEAMDMTMRADHGKKCLDFQTFKSKCCPCICTYPYATAASSIHRCFYGHTQTGASALHYAHASLQAVVNQWTVAAASQQGQ